MINNDLLDDILDYIVYSGRPVTSQEIKKVFNIKDITGNIKTRALIKNAMRDLAVERKIPIGAGKYGYYVIKDRSQLDAYVKNLKNRIAGIQEKIDLVCEAAT